MIFKIATEPQEFERIHALNFKTFVEEIPQHPRNAAARLIDRRHAANTYIICLDGETLAGMVALSAARPFSLDEKLADLDAYLPGGRKLCEIRLLSVAPAYRKTPVFLGLIARLSDVAIARGYDLAVISGTTRELKLYRHLGFTPFGPLVGSAGAKYQPMMLTLERFEGSMLRLIGERSGAVSFLPGPVEVTQEVRAAFCSRPLSHRSETFLQSMASVRQQLLSLTGARGVVVLLGSGTLANDAVAAQLSTICGKGLILANGEFGERLVDHAARWRLACDVYRCDWAQPFDLQEIERRIEARPAWLWMVHCETSTGMLNDFPAVAELCAKREIMLCVDAISSLGTVEVDVSKVAFATGVSGKGLGAFPGLAFVFHAGRLAGSGSIPRYLDLRAYESAASVPFTQSSNLVAALLAALSHVDEGRLSKLKHDSGLLRKRLVERGFACVTPEGQASPAVLTVAVPPTVPSSVLAGRVAKLGYEIAFQSGYLLERNWVQVALMGDYRQPQLTDLAASLEEAYRPFAAALCAASGRIMSSVGVGTPALRAKASGAMSWASISIGRPRS